LFTEEGVDDFHGGGGLCPFCEFAGGEVDDFGAGLEERQDGGLEDEGPCDGGEGIVGDEVGGFDGG
jgi:hypothetical protein